MKTFLGEHHCHLVPGIQKTLPNPQLPHSKSYTSICLVSTLEFTSPRPPAQPAPVIAICTLVIVLASIMFASATYLKFVKWPVSCPAQTHHGPHPSDTVQTLELITTNKGLSCLRPGPWPLFPHWGLGPPSLWMSLCICSTGCEP